MHVTRLLLRDRLGCRVTFPLWDLLISVAVYAVDDSQLGAYRKTDRRNDMAASTCAYRPEGGDIR